MKQYVIIGGGVAAVGCVEGIRSVDTASNIVLISGENRPAYCRPLISYYLQGKTDMEKMKYRPDEFYTANGCELIFDKAVKIDSGAHTVLLAGGQSVAYDALCAATGSAPFVPPFSGLDTVRSKVGFMTEDDALVLDEAVTGNTSVMIIGAGLIGLKCAEGICGRAKRVTVCDIAPRVLSSILDEPCAALIQKQLEEHGVRFLLADSVVRFEGNTAFMESGKQISFDLLVLAVGVTPNTSLIKDVGGETGRGIIVDTAMRTSIPDIYAAGDCAQGYDMSTGEHRVLAIWPNAYMQGRCAGVNMAGESDVFDNAIPMNAIGFFGLHALTAGSYAGDIYEEKKEGAVKRLFVKDGVLSGFIMIGDVAGAGIYTAMIREKTPLSSVDFSTLKKSPSLAPFSSQYRGKKLGGLI